MNKYAVLVSVLAASLILTACGAAPSAASPSPAPSATPEAQSTPTASAPSVTLNATLSDAGLTPGAFTAPVGADVTFTVKNTGTAERDCVFFDLATMKLYPGQSQWSLTQIAAGTTKSLEFTAPAKPASYKVDCGTAGFSGQPRTPTPGLVASLDVK